MRSLLSAVAASIVLSVGVLSDASAGKVLLYDLHQSAPLVRIGILLVLGLTLYAGGWLYQRVLSFREES